ncbi:MAG: peptidase MA family metallohydrolase [Polyangiales bacterium]
MRRLPLFLACALFASHSVSVPAEQAKASDVLDLLEASLTAGEGVPAQVLLDKYLQGHPRSSRTAELEVLADFYSGKYEAAAAGVGKLRERSVGGASLGSLGDVIVETYETTKNFETFSHGNIEVRYAPGDDDLLVPYAVDALKAVGEALEAELGVKMVSPVRLEIYPNADALARVSTLSVEAIRNTGTIALCKWGRLMIASPSTLMHGYPWLDTISHEYVHLLLTKATLDQAPVWLQEGLAKFLETRWRTGEPTLRHDPTSAQLLYEATAADELLSFEQLHPSIALLPSQKAATLAFAQVSSFMETYYREYGRDGVQQALYLIREGEDAKRALANVAGAPWKKLEQRWRSSLEELPKPTPARLLPRRLSGEATEQDELAGVELDRARNYLRLGDLLWTRSRPAAASVEYAKAHKVAPGDPVVASRYARSAIAGGRPKDAMGPLMLTLQRYPTHAPALSSLATVMYRLADPELAREAADKAIAQNPFDPQPHCILSKLDVPQADHEASLCSRLGGMRE